MRNAECGNRRRPTRSVWSAGACSRFRVPQDHPTAPASPAPYTHPVEQSACGRAGLLIQLASPASPHPCPLPKGEGEATTCASAHRLRAGWQPGAIRFSLSLWERAGVRGNKASENAEAAFHSQDVCREQSLLPLSCAPGPSDSAGKPAHSKRFASIGPPRRSRSVSSVFHPCFIRVSSVAKLHFPVSIYLCVLGVLGGIFWPA
jgi:hypothetical protein